MAEGRPEKGRAGDPKSLTVEGNVYSLVIRGGSCKFPKHDLLIRLEVVWTSRNTPKSSTVQG